MGMGYYLTTLNGIYKSGSAPSAYVFHITGMPWAATNSPALKTYLESDTADSRQMLRNMFGVKYDTIPSNVQILPILSNDQGSQIIDYDDSKAISVGGWGVTLNENTAGFSWTNGAAFEGWGILGLDWQPVTTMAGSAWSILDENLSPTTSGTIGCTAYWPEDKDNGLSDWLDDNWNGSSYDTDCNMWLGSTCLLAKDAPTLFNGQWRANCHIGQFNTPNENVFASVDDQSIFMTNYPQSIGGMTANLFSVHMDRGGNVISGTAPFRERTGKVQPGSTDNGQGQWKVNVAGVTDQFKIKSPSDRFEGVLKGYKFNTHDIEGETLPDNNAGYLHMPHIKVIETEVGTASVSHTQVNLDLPTVGGYVEYESIDDIMNAIVVVLNASISLACTYKWENGDLTQTPPSGEDWFVNVHGLVPFICGLGYIHYANVATYFDDLLGNAYASPACFNVNLAGSLPYVSTTINGQTNVPEGWGTSYWALLKESGTVTPLDFDGTRLKNRSTCAYFYQYDLSQVVDNLGVMLPIFALAAGRRREIPADSNGDQRLHYTNTSSVQPIAGDEISLGGAVDFLGNTSPYIHSAKIETVGSDYLEITDNKVIGLPWALYWANGLQSALQTDTGYQQEVQAVLEHASAGMDLEYSTVFDLTAAYSMSDPFALKYNVKVQADNPVEIFKQLLGDPDTDVGVPIALRNTAINDMFDRGTYNSLGLIDWDTMESLIEANRIPGSTFTLDLEPKSGKSGEIDILSLMRNVSMTHGIRMVWQYNESIRSWWMTFKEEGLESYAEVVIGGRIIAPGSVVNKIVGGTMGGDWYYTAITATYPRADGGNDTYNFKNLDSRIQHTLKDKVLTIDDKLTLLPIDTTAAREIIIGKFATYLQTFSTVQYQAKIPATLDSLANISVGSSAVFNLKPLLDRTIGRRNNGDQLGEVRKLTINLGNTPGMVLDCITEPTERGGIGPTMYATGFIQSTPDTKLLGSGAVTDPANNNFQKPSGLTDLGYFGCYDYLEGTGETVLRHTGCGHYAITMFERGTESLFFDPDYLHASQNVWRGTIEVVDLATGSYIIYLDDSNNFSTINDSGAGQFVIQFSHRADSNLQPCQIDLYGWLGNAKGKVVTDGIGSTASAILVRG